MVSGGHPIYHAVRPGGVTVYRPGLWVRQEPISGGVAAWEILGVTDAGRPEGLSAQDMGKSRKMRRWLLILIALAGVLAPTAALGAQSSGPKRLSGGCTAPGVERGYCARLVLLAGLPYFELESYQGGGRYSLCLKPPGSGPERCVSRRLSYHREIRAWLARVAITHVPSGSSGVYTAVWVNATTGHRAGPRMHVTIYNSPSEVPGNEDDQFESSP
jgi:hypothetical protein